MEQVFAVRGRDIVGAGPPSNRDRDVPGVGQVQRGVARPDPAAVFAQRDIADIGARVLDSLKVSPERQQLLGREPAGGDAGELQMQHAADSMIPDVDRMQRHCLRAERAAQTLAVYRDSTRFLPTDPPAANRGAAARTRADRPESAVHGTWSRWPAPTRNRTDARTAAAARAATGQWRKGSSGHTALHE